MRNDPAYEPFLRTIAEHRALDGPRLVFADFLEEAGDPWAHIIRLQIQAEHSDDRVVEIANILREDAHLFESISKAWCFVSHGLRWWALCGQWSASSAAASVASDEMRVVYRRGFVEEVGMPYYRLRQFLLETQRPHFWMLRKIYVWGVPSSWQNTRPRGGGQYGPTLPADIVEPIPWRHFTTLASAPYSGVFSARTPRDIEFVGGIRMIAGRSNLMVHPLHAPFGTPLHVTVHRRDSPPQSGVICLPNVAKPLVSFYANPTAGCFSSDLFLHGDEIISAKFVGDTDPLPIVEDSSWHGVIEGGETHLEPEER